MRILILTQYYPPETGAPQNRLSGLAYEMKAAGHEICILTAMPNYPAMEVQEMYKGKWFVKEELAGIAIYRSWIYVSKKRTIMARLLNYFSFTISSVLIASKVKGDFDLLLCESPPLFLGLSGWWISKRKRARFIFNVSDLWPESAEKLGVITNRFFLRMATRLEEFLYNHAFMVTGQTQGIVQNIKSRFPEKKIHWLPNGVDESIFHTDIDSGRRKALGFEEDDFLILYAGIIGIAQGLDVVLDAAKLIPGSLKVKFLMLGEGPEKERLQARKLKENITSVYFLDLLPREEVPYLVQAINAAVIPLKKMDLFLGAIPSKIFENLALQKPVLLGVDGEAKKLFIEEGKCGIYFMPEDAVDLKDAIVFLTTHQDLADEMGKNGRNYVEKYFLRKNIANDFLLAYYDEVQKEAVPG